MSHIITDVIIGVILLSMLLFVIPIYRHQSDQMALIVGMTDQNEKIGEVIFGEVPKQNDIVSGRYIKELLYYYTVKEESFAVTVKKSGITNLVTESTYENIHSVINEDYMFFKVNEVDHDTYDFCFEYIEAYAEDAI